MDTSTVYNAIHQQINPIPMTDAVGRLGKKWKIVLTPTRLDYSVLCFGINPHRNDITYTLHPEFNPFRFVANERNRYQFIVGEDAMYKLLTTYIETQNPSLAGKIQSHLVHVLAAKLEVSLNQEATKPNNIHDGERMGIWLYAWFRTDSVANKIVNEVIHSLEFQPHNFTMTFFKSLVLWFKKIF